MKRLAVCALLLLPSLSFPAEFSLQLREVRIADLARIVYGDILKRPFVLDEEVLKSNDAVSVDVAKLKRREVAAIMQEVLERRGFEVETGKKILFVRKRQKDDEELLIYQPRHRSAKYLADILAKLADAYQLGTRGMTPTPEFENAIAKQPERAGSAATLMDRGAVDQMAYSCRADQCARLRGLLADLDTAEAQIVLRAALYEVGTIKGEGSALQLAAKIVRQHLNADIGATIAGSNTIGYVNGGLDVVLSVLDQDGRFKTISRPMVRVRSGAQASFSVGQDVPVLGQATLDKNGNPVQSVDYRQSGVILSVTPDIRTDVIELDISQELSSFVATTTGVSGSPTLLKRAVNSKLSIKSGEVVIFAGLNESKTEESQSRFFGLKLSNQSSASDTEILVFVEAVRI